MKSRLLFVVSGLLLLAGPAIVGCAPRPTYSPSADPYYGARSGSAAAAEAECHHVAENASGSTVTEVGKGAIVGGAVGAAAGAAAGAIAGDAGKGAAIGAATGGVGGAVVQGARKNQHYNDVYASCMRERGYAVY
jgi:hypothetical protein